jgi:acylphosphatase
MTKKSIRAMVKGRVQGVSFRAFTWTEAQKLGLTGFVKNTPDGGVEVFAEGDESKLKVFVAKIHEGPSASFVEKVDYEFGEATGKFTSFEITY